MIVAQISDLHVRPRGAIAYDRIDTAPMLEAAVQAVRTLSPAPDCVIATGDLTDRGLAEEYVLLDEILAGLPMPVFLVPGNHDRRETMRKALGHRLGRAPASGPMHQVIEEFPLRLVLLDSVLDGETEGELGPGGRAWLSGCLAAGMARPTLIGIHHAPFAVGITGMDTIGLRDGEEMRAIVARHPEVERVACGHHHRTIVRRWGGTIGFISPSTVHQVALDLRPDARTKFVCEPPGISVHHWSAEAGLSTHVVPVGDYGGPFDFNLDPAYPGAKAKT